MSSIDESSKVERTRWCLRTVFSVRAWVAVALALPPWGSALAHDGAAEHTATPASPFPKGLSPQWLNVANVDPVACFAAIEASGAKFVRLAPQPRPDRKGCGMPHGVVVSRGPTGISYHPPLVVDCSFAAELGPMESIFQDEARRELGASIQRIDTLGAYACVTKAGPYTTRYSTKPAISEHSFGVAYDLRSFTTTKGQKITVERDYERGTSTPVAPAGRFLFDVATRLRHETRLTHVLTPDFNAEHRNHFHLDRGLPFGWWWDADEGAPQGAP